MTSCAGEPGADHPLFSDDRTDDPLHHGAWAHCGARILIGTDALDIGASRVFPRGDALETPKEDLLQNQDPPGSTLLHTPVPAEIIERALLRHAKTIYGDDAAPAPGFLTTSPSDAFAIEWTLHDPEDDGAADDDGSIYLFSVRLCMTPGSFEHEIRLADEIGIAGVDLVPFGLKAVHAVQYTPGVLGSLDLGPLLRVDAALFSVACLSELLERVMVKNAEGDPFIKKTDAMDACASLWPKASIVEPMLAAPEKRVLRKSAYLSVDMVGRPVSVWTERGGIRVMDGGGAIDLFGLPLHALTEARSCITALADPRMTHRFFNPLISDYMAVPGTREAYVSGVAPANPDLWVGVPGSIVGSGGDIRWMRPWEDNYKGSWVAIAHSRTSFSSIERPILRRGVPEDLRVLIGQMKRVDPKCVQKSRVNPDVLMLMGEARLAVGLGRADEYVGDCMCTVPDDLEALAVRHFLDRGWEFGDPRLFNLDPEVAAKEVVDEWSHSTVEFVMGSRSVVLCSTRLCNTQMFFGCPSGDIVGFEHLTGSCIDVIRYDNYDEAAAARRWTWATFPVYNLKVLTWPARLAQYGLKEDPTLRPRLGAPRSGTLRYGLPGLPEGMGRVPFFVFCNTIVGSAPDLELAQEYWAGDPWVVYLAALADRWRAHRRGDVDAFMLAGEQLLRYQVRANTGVSIPRPVGPGSPWGRTLADLEGGALAGKNHRMGALVAYAHTYSGVSSRTTEGSRSLRSSSLGPVGATAKPAAIDGSLVFGRRTRRYCARAGLFFESIGTLTTLGVADEIGAGGVWGPDGCRADPDAPYSSSVCIVRGDDDNGSRRRSCYGGRMTCYDQLGRVAPMEPSRYRAGCRERFRLILAGVF